MDTTRWNWAFCPFQMVLANSMGCPFSLEWTESMRRAGEPGDPRWSVGVLDQERRVGFSDFFEAGQWELTVGALEAGAVLERIVIGRDGACRNAYLGPAESECTGAGKTPA